MSAKQVINDKLEDSVATRCSGVVKSVCEKLFKIGEYLAKLQAGTWLSSARSSSSSSVVARHTKCKFTFFKYLPVKKIENRLRFDRIVAMSLGPRFLAYPVRCCQRVLPHPAYDSILGVVVDVAVDSLLCCLYPQHHSFVTASVFAT